ncbi:phenylalanine--tRNA ligase subunit alpha, partial [Candidatus Sumerlaeota bacterium]|nr:phenylalanine--tRNA ligase subunit alpha [Candidatus Sumerlaeota bacterium]
KVGELPQEERPQLGKRVNEIKERLLALIDQRSQELKIKELEESVAAERIDITMPGIRPPRAQFHPINQVLQEINDIFVSMGFKIATGPDIETDYYNFGALNFPPDHPARDLQDTFFLKREGLLLRTHTSPVQIRVMQKQRPPIAIIAPGKVFRCDADVSHSPMFHQVEGLLVDHNVSFANLKAVLNAFAQQLFGKETQTRFRPSFFPFTEPSAEVDIQCIFCRGSGCRICQHTGWIEVLGCGMVHPAVFENVNINPQEYSGFAFGMGVERLAMLKYGINDIRLFFEGDIRFLSQF